MNINLFLTLKKMIFSFVKIVSLESYVLIVEHIKKTQITSSLNLKNVCIIHILQNGKGNNIPTSQISSLSSASFSLHQAHL